MITTHVPLNPVNSKTPRWKIKGYFGGILPVFDGDSSGYSGACHCEVGTYMMKLYKMIRYDSIPGTSREDTKESIIAAELERWKAA